MQKTKNSVSSVWASAGDDIAGNHDTKLATKADTCSAATAKIAAPFSVKQMSRMVTIDKYFSGR